MTQNGWRPESFGFVDSAIWSVVSSVLCGHSPFTKAEENTVAPKSAPWAYFERADRHILTLSFTCRIALAVGHFVL